MIEVIITSIVVGFVMSIIAVAKMFKNVPDSECRTNSNCCNFNIKN